jgi:hypothetical protein
MWVIDSFFPSRQSVSVVSVKEVVLMKNSSGGGAVLSAWGRLLLHFLIIRTGG